MKKGSKQILNLFLSLSFLYLILSLSAILSFLVLFPLEKSRGLLPPGSFISGIRAARSNHKLCTLRNNGSQGEFDGYGRSHGSPSEIAASMAVAELETCQAVSSTEHENDGATWYNVLPGVRPPKGRSGTRRGGLEGCLLC